MVLITNDGVFVTNNQYYGSLDDATSYFSTKLNSEVWGFSENNQKIAALTEATIRIDRLNFHGQKTATDQAHEFPRYDNLDIPQEINYAAYEIALKLLDDKEPDTELENIAVESHGYSPVRTTYIRTFALPHILAGIPSPLAWSYLQPFLRHGGIKLRRVN